MVALGCARVQRYAHADESICAISYGDRVPVVLSAALLGLRDCVWVTGIVALRPNILNRVLAHSGCLPIRARQALPIPLSNRSPFQPSPFCAQRLCKSCMASSSWLLTRIQLFICGARFIPVSAFV